MSFGEQDQADQDQEQHEAAVILQRRVRAWASGKSVASVKWTEIIDAQLEIKKRHDEIQSKVLDIIFYVIFLVCFTTTAVFERQDEEIYHFSRGVVDQLCHVEYSAEHSPTFGKTFLDITTIKEYHQWLEGVFLPDTYLSQNSDHFQSNEGYLFDSTQIVVGIRIGQLRSRKFPCKYENTIGLQDNSRTCFSFEGDFNKDTEGICACLCS